MRGEGGSVRGEGQGEGGSVRGEGWDEGGGRDGVRVGV